MKSLLFLPVLWTITHSTNIITLPAPTTIPPVEVNYNYGSSATFDLEWVVADGNPQLSNMAYIGMGFQNGHDTTAEASSLDMFGPEGADYFTLRGKSSLAVAEFHTLGERPPTKKKGTKPVKRESHASNTTQFPDGSRITAVKITTSTTDNSTTYTVTINCAPGSVGMVDFARPVAALFALGPVNSEGNIRYHQGEPENRGWKHGSSTSGLVLYTICSSGAALPNVISLMALVVAAALALLTI